MIRKIDVLNLLESIKDNKDIPKNNGTFMDVIRQIRNMPTIIQESNWIPCNSGNLPTITEKQIPCGIHYYSNCVWVTLDNEEVVEAVLEDTGRWFREDNGMLITEQVIAWKEFSKPMPYKNKQ